MLKVISLLKRREDMTLEEFRQWATEEHPELGKKLPGIRRYFMSVVLEDSPDLPYHAVSEFWFDDKEAMLAAFALGAEGVQVGSRFAISEESSAHINFKKRIVEAREGETVLTMKQLTPVRIIKNSFYTKIKKAEDNCAPKDELQNILGKGRAKKGIFEGELEQGELEIGQISGSINDILPAETILKSIWNEFLETRNHLAKLEI